MFGGEWKPDNGGDGWNFWQDVAPKPGELKRQAYVGHLNNQGEWLAVSGQQGAPFPVAETDRNLNEVECNEQNQDEQANLLENGGEMRPESRNDFGADRRTDRRGLGAGNGVEINEIRETSDPKTCPIFRPAGNGAMDAIQPESSGGLGVGAEPGEQGEIGEQPTTDHQALITKPKVSKSKKARRSPVSKVLNFPLLTGEQATKTNTSLTGEQKKTKSRKQRTSAALLTGEQADEIKQLLPTLDAGFYWEAPADAKGFKIKLRWRDAEKKLQCYVFRRLGKFELQTLRKGTYEEQRSDLADRLTGELIENGRTELTARIKAEPQNHSRSAHPNSAIA